MELGRMNSELTDQNRKLKLKVIPRELWSYFSIQQIGYSIQGQSWNKLLNFHELLQIHTLINEMGILNSTLDFFISFIGSFSLSRIVYYKVCFCFLIVNVLFVWCISLQIVQFLLCNLSVSFNVLSFDLIF